MLSIYLFSACVLSLSFSLSLSLLSLVRSLAPFAPGTVGRASGALCLAPSFSPSGSSSRSGGSNRRSSCYSPPARLVHLDLRQ